MSRIILIVVLLLLALRFVGLDVSPTGFFSDEAGAVYNMLCLGSAGKWLLFLPCSEGDGAYPLIFIYLGSLWVNIFGSSIYSYRFMGNLFIILTIVMLYPLALNLYRRSGEGGLVKCDLGFASVGLWTCLAAAISPWSFQMGRFVSENSLALLLLTGALLLLSGAGAEPSRHRRLAAALCLAMSMYAYSPLVVVAPLLVVAFALFFTDNFSLRFWSGFFALLAVFVIPLFYVLYFGSNLPRVNSLLLWQSGRSVVDALAGAGKTSLPTFRPSIFS
jgi:4-amino-4-deoxy-L-arabinose transferase-like glycosyltransferase